MESFPERCIRGLSDKEDVTQEGRVNSQALYPNFKPKTQRPDKAFETSINWEDDETVIAFTRKQREQSAYGVAALRLEAIDYEIRASRAVGLLTYERQKLPSNQYHGNIVFAQEISQRFAKTLAAALATKAVIIPPSD